MSDDPAARSASKGRAGPRLGVLDLIRGVGVLGILPVHIGLFSGPGMNPQQGAESWGDHLLNALVMLVFEGKMVTLLSILFGVGLAMQAREAEGAGRQFAPYYRRRMAVLFAFGLLHALFLFHFDILTSYAVAGMIALFFLRRSDRALRRVAAVCLAWCYSLVVLFLVLSFFFEPAVDSPPDGSPPAAMVAAPPADGVSGPPPSSEPLGFIESLFSEEHETHVFREGGLREMVGHRAVYLGMVVLLFWLETGWYILACILAGVWLVRRGVLDRVDAHRPLFRRFIALGLPLGGTLHVGALVAYLRDPESEVSLCLVVLGVLPLALCYLSWLVRWAESGRAPWLQALLRSVGRMSLSNYLLQSVLCGLVFYGYGFGLYGRLDKATTFGIVLAIWLLLLLLSQWWMRRFSIGPAEWLWRKMTDRKRPVGAGAA